MAMMGRRDTMSIQMMLLVMLMRDAVGDLAHDGDGDDVDMGPLLEVT